MSELRPFVRDKMAELVVAIRFDRLPADVVKEAKRLMLDTLACAVGALGGEPVEAVRATAHELGGAPQATAIGERRRTSCALATLVNGTLFRYQDANDYYFGRDPSHASGNLAPVLAVAEHMHCSGADALAAFVAAYEVQLRLCDFAGMPSLWDRGWHHATNMQFASAAAAARLLGLSPTQIADAISIAGTHNNTLTESMRGRMCSMKTSIEASTAKAGVEAALLAKNGLTGPEGIFEGDFGWTRVVAGEVDYAGLTAPLGDHYKIMDTCMKPYSAHALSQGLIEATRCLTEENTFGLDDIESITGFLAEPVFRQPSMDKAKLNPQNRETADHSPSYLIAVALLEKACGPAQFRPELLNSPPVRKLIGLITLSSAPQLDKLYPASMAGGIEVRLRGGRRLEKFVIYPPGHPRNRLSDAQVEAKFVRYASPSLRAGDIDALIESVWNFDRIDDVSQFMATLQGA
ncbi:MAG: MmgE/PrpD family protein [Pseudolabrys sp.]|jgi:2-methylcitrate dehydratase